MKANKSRGGYSKAMPSDLRLAREAREAAEAGPAAEAKRREERMLASLVGAREDFEWIAARKGWTLLGFDTCFDWWSAHVRPVADGLGLRPEPEFAKRVIALVEQEQAALPTTQRSSKKELAELVGASEWAARGRKETRQRRSAAGVDLDPSSVIDVEPTSVTDEPTETETDDPDPADIPAAVTQLLTETAAASVGAGVTMPPARPAESPCSDAPDRAHCAAADCGADLSGNEQAAGHLRCRSCDPLTLHKANGIGVEEGYGECDECAIQARIADRTSAAVTAANTDGVFPPVGEPVDVEKVAASTGTPSSEENSSDGEDAQPRVAPVGSEPGYDGLGSGELEERIEEEAATPRERIPLPVYCHDCKSIDERCEQHRDSSAATFSSTAVVRLISPAADPIEHSHAGVPAVGGYPETFDDLGCPRCSYVVEVSEEDPDASLSEMFNHISARCATGEGEERRRSARELLAQVRLISPAGAGIFSDPEVPAVATARPEIDHHTSAGVSDSGEAPEVRASVEPVLEGGGLAPDPSSSSDPEPHPGDRLLHALGVLVHLIDELDPEALGPYLFPGEVELLHLHADRIAEFVGRVGLARTAMVGGQA